MTYVFKQKKSVKEFSCFFFFGGPCLELFKMSVNWTRHGQLSLSFSGKILRRLIVTNAEATLPNLCTPCFRFVF
ncbi:Uncharacterized protein APZ42_031716 [Daphnia magna]|uniref:Uncharacterized protein n=1 Tax=Daphnia magna TaxID=35525 RepID=A0A164MK75_9CRUS|nr:Uncharacterized protein APZ42_031716 [Daphnia magna]